MMTVSFIIPTYNRSKYLEVLIKRFEHLKVKHSGAEFELVIANNASTDDTESIIKQAIEREIVSICYKKQDKNIGFVRNLLSAIALGNGKYWYFIGDDDLVNENDFGRLIAHLSASQSPLIMFSRSFEPLIDNKRWTLNEFCRNFFYRMGNANMAVQNEFTKAILDSNYTELTLTCWPQTHLALLSAAATKAAPESCDICVYEEQPKNNNNVPNSYYHLNSQFTSLCMLGSLLDKKIADRSLFHPDNAIAGNPFAAYPKVIKFFIFTVCGRYKILDLANEQKDCIQEIKEFKASDIKIGKNRLYLFKIGMWLPDFFYLTVFSFKKFREMRPGNKNVNLWAAFREVSAYRTEKLQIMSKPASLVINKGDW